jgi:CheY-like chemotaxis protein
MGHGRILIVDDELDMRIYLSTLLKTSGYEPQAVRNGQEGIARARQQRPDLILLDVMMPKEGGVQMYRLLRTDPTLAGIPVIMLSGVPYSSFSHYLAMLSATLGQTVPQPDAYLEKPVDPETLLPTVAALLA